MLINGSFTLFIYSQIDTFCTQAVCPFEALVVYRYHMEAVRRKSCISLKAFSATNCLFVSVLYWLRRLNQVAEQIHDTPPAPP
jgi:hypothetical protein